MLSAADVKVPGDVPESGKEAYIDNFLSMTRGSGRLMLFAGDQKVEHLNKDFYGPGIDPDDADPQHLFKIAGQAEIGVFAAQFGLISLYGRDYPQVRYLVKLNSKSPLVPTAQMDPVSRLWADVDQVMAMKEATGLKILGVGYTIYLGSEYEGEMLQEAARIINRAHRYGLITVLWIYPRGGAVKDEKDPGLIAGATGVAACLGSDFVKVNYPEREGSRPEEIFKEAVRAAGRCRVVCAGGESVDVKSFLTRLHNQIFISGAHGNATGRNIHQKSLHDAVRMCNAISAVTICGMDVNEALAVYEGEKKLTIESR